MKRIYLIAACFLLYSRPVQAQSPVDWQYTAIRITDSICDVHITAQIQKGWHLYSQNQPMDAIAVPTKIRFSANPLVKPLGATFERGELYKYSDTALGISAFQYENKVDFVQEFILRATAKTNIMATLMYQVCSNQKCLPPKTIVLKILVP